MKKASLVVLIVVVAIAAGVGGYFLGRSAAPAAGTTDIPDVQPAVVTHVDPKYPDIALKAGIEGTVYVKVDVDASGAVTGTGILQSAHPALDEAAKEAARQWTFKPATKNGVPMAVSVTIPFKFKLADTDSGKKTAK